MHMNPLLHCVGIKPRAAPYMNPNERRVNQQIKSDVCANRFYQYIEELKDQVSEYLDKQFGRWY